MNVPAYLFEMAKVYQSWAQRLCAPVFFEDVDGTTHNGTMTFLKTEKELLGITNKHVAAGIAKSSAYGKRCNIGGTELDAERLIAEHSALDLATFRLSEVMLANAGLLADGTGDPFKHQPATVTSWPPLPPATQAPVMYGGYPGSQRNPRADGNVDFGFFWVANKVETASKNNIGMVIDLGQSISVGERRLEQGADLGGWSGGPVFCLVDENAIERLELAAIIYEYSARMGIVFAHPLSDLNPDGTFVI